MAEVATPNAPSPEVIRDAVSEIEGFNNDLEAERMEYMGRCKGIRESIKSAKQRAKNAGIDVRALMTMVEQRKLEKRIESIRFDLDGDQFSFLKVIEDAYGEDQ